MENHIVIKCWTGKELFKGHYKDEQVDRILEANRCSTCVGSGAYCKECGGDGYSGDFIVYWLNENDKRNVYEYINY